MRRHVATPGTYLFRAGDPCAHFAVLAEGVVRVSASSPAGREMLLYRLRPGELCTITLSCLLGGVPYPADGIAETAVRAYLVPRHVFVELYDQQPSFRTACHRLFAARLAELMCLLAQVAFGTTIQRLAALLVQRGPRVETTHERLALELGTSREVVSRGLKRLERRGLVLTRRGQIEVLDDEGLRRLSASAW